MASYVLRFEDFEPSPRNDGVVWTQAQILEAATQDGTYTVIDTVDLSPLDTDPTMPQQRNFSTANATMAEGWYQIVFLDDSSGQSPAEPVFHSAERSGYMPGVGDVGALLTARTRDANGNEAGTFTAATRPTRAQVETLINKAASRTLAKLPASDVPQPLWESISNVISLSAAMRVELSFFPEQIAANRSPYTELKALRDEELADLIVAIEAVEAVAGDEDPNAPATLPVFGFPAAVVRTPGSEWPYDLRWRL